MHIKILAVGQKMPEWINQGYQHFQQRLPRQWNVELIEIQSAKRTKSTSAAQALAQESERILSLLPVHSFIVALDVKGQQISTEHLADKLQQWQMTGRDLYFLIGGADGLSAQCLARADFHWSLSALVFPHGIARLLLIEQLYRAWSIINHHPYHSGH